MQAKNNGKRSSAPIYTRSGQATQGQFKSIALITRIRGAGKRLHAWGSRKFVFLLNIL